MIPILRDRAKLFELVGIVLALDERHDLDASEQRRRDRKFRSLPTAVDQHDLDLLRRWIRNSPTESLRTRIESLRSSIVGLRWLLIAIGFFLGWAAASTLLSVRMHEDRINIVLSIVLLVVIPFCLNGLSVLGWLGSLRSSSERIPGSIATLLRNLGIGRLAFRFLPNAAKQDVEIVTGRLTAHGRLYGPIERGQFLISSQVVGLTFGLGACFATLAFVTFTDLAFGWSTTLDVSAIDVHQVVRFVSVPWASLWPAASPSFDLVETTRYFRVAPEPHSHIISPILYGGWWPFLLMSIMTYVILPRALVIASMSFWLARQTGLAIRLTPGVDQLIGQLTTPVLERQATAIEFDAPRSSNEVTRVVESIEWIEKEAAQGILGVVRWAETSVESAIESPSGFAPFPVLEAGGRCSLEEDAAARRALAKGKSGIVFCTRGYEPPVLDILDFLEALRKEIGRERPILVALTGASRSNLQTWSRKLLMLGDPRLSVGRIEPSHE